MVSVVGEYVLRALDPVAFAVSRDESWLEPASVPFVLEQRQGEPRGAE